MTITLNSIVKAAVDGSASDLYLTEGKVPSMKVNGELCRLELPELTEDVFAEVRKQTGIELYPLVRPKTSEKSSTNVHGLSNAEEDFACTVPLNDDGTNSVRLRGNFYFQSGKQSLVLRILPQTIPDIEDIKLPRSLRADILTMTHGLVLITGPTSSGKSTTMASLIQHINRHKPKHIVTIEDPIEYRHTDHVGQVHQREVGSDTGSFHAALRAALRQAPDVLMVGEMRDPETIGLALSAAELGVLVIGTLHSSTADSAINRIIDVFPGDRQEFVRVMLSESLKIVLSQRLLPGKDTGRVGVFELLKVNSAIASSIRTNRAGQIRDAMGMNKSHGMTTFTQHLEILVNQDLICPKAAEQFRFELNKT